MKTTIGIIHNLVHLPPHFENLATEFFGVISKTRNKKKNGILWITFPSKKNAQEFSNAVDVKCVDNNQNRFK